MKKYITIFVLLFLLFSLVETKKVKADFGPKPSLTITVIGINEPYSFDVLYEHPNPYVYTTEELEHHLQFYFTDNYPEFLNGYQDLDGYASYYLNGIGGIRRTINESDKQEYLLDYYPPSTFKIIIVTDDGNVIISDIITTAAFDTVMTYDLNGVDTSVNQTGVGVFTGNFDAEDLTRETVIRTILRVIYTIGIEIGVLYLFKYRKKNTYIIVGIVNLVTQVGLSYAVVSTAVYSNIFFATLILFAFEFVVVTVEGIFYIFTLKEQSKLKALAYAVTANSASLAIGYIVLVLLQR